MLQVIQLNWMQFCIGANFSITTPCFQKRLEDPTLWRCLSVGVGLMGFQLFITVPLWIEARA